jgi:hypothetical protein
MAININDCAIPGIGLYALSESDHKTVKVITEVALGKQCGCVCPQCKKPVVAKNREFIGRKNRLHFAHLRQSGSGISTDHPSCSPESALHSLAKIIIKNNKKIMVPKWMPKQPLGDEFVEINELLNNQKEYIEFAFAEEELNLNKNNIRPDLACYSLDNCHSPICFIEITVTNKLSLDKIEIYKKMNIDVLEIDLSYLYNNDCKYEEINIEKEILSKITNKRMVFSKVESEFNKMYSACLESLLNRKLIENSQKVVSHHKVGIEISGRPYINHKIGKLCIDTSQFNDITNCNYAIIRGDYEYRYLRYIWVCKWEGETENGIPVLDQVSYLT